MKKYNSPRSLNPYRMTGKEVFIVPLLAEAVGFAAGAAIAGAAMEGGRSVAKKMFGDFSNKDFISNSSNFKIGKLAEEF